MIRSYFKIAWRNILKNKLFSIINIVGLAIGLACSILILLWVQGDENTVLKDIHSIILTEKMAKKVFAEEDPVGQSILVFDQYEFVVSGVIQDPPLNSHLTFIRKVFGAGTTTILYILSKGYIKLILISIGVAVPVSNYIIQDWLNKFAYKTDITVLTFLVPSLGLILVSVIIVVGQSVKGNRKNVIEILRNQ